MSTIDTTAIQSEDDVLTHQLIDEIVSARRRKRDRHGRAKTIVQFFAALFGTHVGGEDRLTLWLKPSLSSGKTQKPSFHLDNIHEAARCALSRRDDYDVFFGVALRRNGLDEHHRGGNVDVTLIPGLWVDLDIGKPGDAEHRPSPSNEVEAQRLLDRLPLKPSIVIRSGHGLHVYFLFNEPLAAQEINGLIGRWKAYILAHADSLGFGLDKGCFDLSRVLRVPCTFNHKDRERNAHAPVLPVSIHTFEPTRRYTLDQVEEMLDLCEDVPADIGEDNSANRTEATNDTATVSMSGPQQPQALDFSAPLRPIAEGHRNTTLFDLACSLRGRGLSQEAIEHELLTHNRATCLPPLDEDEVLNIARSVARYPAGKNFTLDDTGNAERFAQDHGAVLRYCQPWHQWLMWDGRRWKADETGHVMLLTKNTIAAILLEAGRSPEQIAKVLSEHAKRSRARSKRENMLALAQAELPILPDVLDKDPMLLNVRNGTLDLKTGKLLAQDPGRYLTKLADVEYDPDATCPTWLKFLDGVFDGDQETINYLQRFFGYSLSGLTDEHIFMVCYGQGRNGKSTLIKTVAGVMGDHAVALPPRMLVKRSGEAHLTELASLWGVRLAYTNESTEDSHLDEERVKLLTGGDAITCRRLYENLWSFQPSHKLLMATNHRPRVTDNGEGMWSRVKEVPFRKRFIQASDLDYDQANGPKADPKLAEKLRAEYSGILTWMVQGCQKWQQAGLRPSEAVRQATLAYKSGEDIIGGFIEECCIVGADQESRGGSLYEGYKEWCKENGSEVVSDRKFKDYIGKIAGVRKDRTRYGSRWTGIGLRPAPEITKEPEQA